MYSAKGVIKMSISVTDSSTRFSICTVAVQILLSHWCSFIMYFETALGTSGSWDFWWEHAEQGIKKMLAWVLLPSGTTVLVPLNRLWCVSFYQLKQHLLSHTSALNFLVSHPSLKSRKLLLTTQISSFCYLYYSQQKSIPQIKNLRLRDGIYSVR